MKLRTSFFLFFLFSMLQLYPFYLHSQQVRLTGKTIDVNTYQAIPYVNIYIKGTQIGTISDFAGKFSLFIPKANPKMVLIFQHINYDPKEIPLKDYKDQSQIYLQPRIIPLPEVQIEAVGEQLEIKKDLPQMISVLKAKEFELRGYVDAGDLLRTDHSIQVEEEMSGKKTISIRGGNADDVVVLYNGIKMNSQFNHIFDFSLIDLEDVERLEIVKGSNTVLYGSEAFSGVINIVPKIEQDYTIRFQQRIGTYDSGNWGLHLYKALGKLHASYHIRQAGARRMFVDAITDKDYLENLGKHQTASLEYRFVEGLGGIAKSSLNATYLESKIEYDDYRANENVENSNQILNLKFSGDIYKLRNLHLSLGNRKSDEKLTLNSQTGWLDRQLNDHTIDLHLGKDFRLDDFDLVLAYQYEQSRLKFDDIRGDFSYQNIQQQAAQIKRQRQGIISILKIHAPSGSKLVKNVDFDFSFRHDRVNDSVDDSDNYHSTILLDSLNNWQETTIKFAAQFKGYYQNFSFDIFMNIGKNVKFPTLSQLISSQLALTTAEIESNLQPEKNRSVEIGITLKRDLSTHPTIYGWQISGNYIKNYYDNKFRPYFIVGLPIAFYDNVLDARISGFETKSSVFLFRKKVTLELGLSHYNISEKAAFPFKYEMKRILNFRIDHAGYSFLLHWFKEGEQTGWVRQLNGAFTEVILPDFSNVDIHLSKTFNLWKFKLFGNLSLRNLLNNETVLEGLALRDRRYYLTAGIQY